MAYFRTGKTDDVTNTAGPTSSRGYVMVAGETGDTLSSYFKLQVRDRSYT